MRGFSLAFKAFTNILEESLAIKNDTQGKKGGYVNIGFRYHNKPLNLNQQNLFIKKDP